VSSDPLIGTVGGELGRRELPIIIDPKHPELAAALLRHRLDVALAASDLAAWNTTNM
jgi:hypothetical protein